MEKVVLLSNRVWIAENASNGNLQAKIVICDFSTNLNGVRLNRDTVENWMHSIINQPLVGKIKKSLASFVFGTLGGSRSTAFEMVGIDPLDEKAKRERENEEGYDDIFYARQTAYTSTGNEGAGRPAGTEDVDHQAYDQEYQRND